MTIGGARHLFWQILPMLFLCLCLCLLPPAPVTRADGGAPDLAYIAGTPAGVSVIDVVRRRVTRPLRVSGNPQSILLNLDGSLLYASQPALGRVVVINTRTGATVCSVRLPGQPSLLTQTPTGDAVFVGGGTVVHAIDPRSCVVTRRFQVPGPVAGLTISFFPAAFSANAGTFQLWVASRQTLTVFDTRGSVLGRFPVPADPEHVIVPPQSAFLYFTTRAGTVMAFDILHRTFTAPLLVGGVFGLMDFDDSNGEVFIPDLAHGRLDVLTPLDPATRALPNAPARSIRLPGAPVGVAIASGGQLGFVALQDGQVAMLDMPGRQVVATIAVGGSPHFIVTGPYPPSSPGSPPLLPGGPTPAKSLSWDVGLVLAGALLILVVLGTVLALRVRVDR